MAAGLHVIAITNPRVPVYLSSYDPQAGGAYDVEVVGDYAFTAGLNFGLRVIELNTARTVYTLIAEVDPTQGRVDAIFVRGNYAYCASGNGGLRIWDISDVTVGTPADFDGDAEAGIYDPGNETAVEVEVAGDYAFVSFGDDGVYVIDISTPTAPSYSYTLASGGAALHAQVAGDYLYVADDTGGLQVWDLTPLPGSTPTLTETYNANTPTYKNVYVSGFHAFIADDADGLRVLDVSAYDSPVQKSHPRLNFDFIGIPATVTSGVPATLFGDDLNNTDPGYPNWRLSRWDDANQKYARENEADRYYGEVGTNDDPPDFAPGLGYWLYQDVVTNCVLDISVAQNTGIVDQADTTEVALSPGRVGGSKTMLANPYHYPYDLSTTYFSIDGAAPITKAAAVTGSYINANVYTFNPTTQGYNDPIPYNASINPWKGFWVIQTDNTVSIDFLFAPDGFGGFALGEENPGSPELDEEEWYLRLSVISTDSLYQDYANRLGVSSRSEDDYDPYDAFELTPMGSHFVQLFFPHPEWEDFPNNYTWDLRSVDFDSLKTWDVSLRTWNTPETEYIITWPNIDEIPEDYAFILVDPESGEQLADMREVDQVTFTTGEFTGDYEFVDYRLNVIYTGTSVSPDQISIPEEFSLTSLYPNPFNSTITATIGLPETSVLEMRVYNILGKEVGVLAEGRYSAGYHRLNFNADDLASGIYFIHAIVPGEMKLVRKIVLLR
ncbi:MAG: T9SS type A sorting domain-containing protein [Candidatus Electryonea clarkiae]|nr:T9SS type A sorting domain-containing protein [Candidatus Electryonea clarkiae]MDP8288418.1 T9SS type A sorting domain-containing protein [Candidatus Electryonea clarkiae]